MKARFALPCTTDGESAMKVDWPMQALKDIRMLRVENNKLRRAIELVANLKRQQADERVAR